MAHQIQSTEMRRIGSALLLAQNRAREEKIRADRCQQSIREERERADRCERLITVSTAPNQIRYLIVCSLLRSIVNTASPDAMKDSFTGVL